MEAMRQSWTDSRMDDLNARVDELSHKVADGFAGVDGKIDSLGGRLDGKIDKLGERLDGRIDTLDGKIDRLGETLGGRIEAIDGKVDNLGETLGGRIDALGGRIDSLNHAILVAGGGLLAAFVAFTAALIGVIITQL